MRAYAVGHLVKPWRLLRHSLFISGLSLIIATGAIVGGTLLQRDPTPPFSKASAPRAAGAANEGQQRGESTSIGALTRLIKSSGSEPAATAAASATGAASSAEAEPGRQPEGDARTGEAPPPAEARAGAALTGGGPMIAERPAEQGDLLVTSGRFKVKSTPAVSEAATRTQTTAAALPDLAAGDRITVPVTFYYCEDSTGGQRRGDGGGFCGVMRDGSPVYPGAAACEYQYLGQRFRIEGDPTGRVYVCADTGSGIHGQHRDIWFMNSSEGWSWQQVVGRSAVIQVLP